MLLVQLVVSELYHSACSLSALILCKYSRKKRCAFSGGACTR